MIKSPKKVVEEFLGNIILYKCVAKDPSGVKSGGIFDVYPEPGKTSGREILQGLSDELELSTWDEFKESDEYEVLKRVQDKLEGNSTKRIDSAERFRIERFITAAILFKREAVNLGNVADVEQCSRICIKTAKILSERHSIFLNVLFAVSGVIYKMVIVGE